MLNQWVMYIHTHRAEHLKQTKLKKKKINDDNVLVCKWFCITVTITVLSLVLCHSLTQDNTNNWRAPAIVRLTSTKEKCVAFHIVCLTGKCSGY